MRNMEIVILSGILYHVETGVCKSPWMKILHIANYVFLKDVDEIHFEKTSWGRFMVKS